MSPDISWLIQRFVPTVPNETTGAWVDEGTITDLKASEADKAVARIAETSPAVGRRRAIRWDTAEEYDSTPGPPTTEKVPKASREATFK